MLALEQLTLNGAVTLLTYLQHARLEDETTGTIAIAATLCEMLSQLEAMYPGITTHYGWQQIHPDSSYTGQVVESASVNYLYLEDDRCSSFQPASLS
ncbi:MAG: hypothetical protein ACAF41_20395 [Leptolyngbya sp. BL-A-14]